MLLDNLPYHIFYKLCKYLSFIDIINLSITCKQLYRLIENDDYFWMMLIQNHFGSKLYHRYVNEIFENKKNSNYDLYRTEDDKQEFEKSFQKYRSSNRCNNWLFNVLNCKDNSNGYLAYRSIIKQKKCARTNQLKMSLTIEELFEYYFKTNKYLNKENILHISIYKLIYFYLIQCKRLLGVDLFAIKYFCTPNHSRCFNVQYPVSEYDLYCLTGRCIRLFSPYFLLLVGVKGKFKSILPGTYEIVCRIKLDKYNRYLTYYNEWCSKRNQLAKGMQCYFYALADHGLDCKCDGKTLNFDWFESNYLLYGNQWFNQTMGYIKVFELSDIYFGFRTEFDYGYLNVLLDYIQLNVVE